jgi:NAD(P)-dependent dehydrogenase (short-subunit alcohol dehydrogenase family)
MTAETNGTGRLAGRIALVTGASRGIGAAIAKAYAREGAQLVLLARTVGALEEMDDAVRAAGAPPALLVPLDLRDFDAIDRLGASLYERYSKLDVLVANAGILGALSPTSHIDPKVWQQVIDINLTANYRLIRSLEPLLKRSEAGRAVFLTSGAARGVRPYWGAELLKTNLKVNLVNPGATRTAMRAAAYPTEDPQSLKTPEEIAETFVQLGMAEDPRHGELIDL